MNALELKLLEEAVMRPKAVSAKMLVNQSARTLIYGYTCNRETFHLYLDEQAELQLVTYDYDGLLLTHQCGELVARECVPDKRVYPERCDYEFCALLVSMQVSVPFTGFDADVKAASFYGKTLADLITVPDGYLKVIPPVVSLEELGVSDVYLNQLTSKEQENLKSSIASAMKASLEESVRSVLIRKEGVNSKKWLKNLPVGLEHVVEKFLVGQCVHMEFVNKQDGAKIFSISADAGKFVIDLCMKAKIAHLKSIGAICPDEAGWESFAVSCV